MNEPSKPESVRDTEASTDLTGVDFINATVDAVLRDLDAAVAAQPPDSPYPVTYDALFVANADIIVRETLGSVVSGSRGYAVVPSTTDAHVMETTGNTHALRGIHPAVGLASAELLFDVALPIVVRAFDAFPGRPFSGVAIAQALHHATWRRFPPGAVAYVEELLRSVSTAREEGRKFLSRELHDHVAHDIALALMRLESASAPDEADLRQALRGVDEILRRTLEQVQDLAVAARTVVGHRGFAAAIADLAEVDENARVPLLVTLDDETGYLSEPVGEEGLTIVQEAIRNARRHAHGVTHIDLRLSWAVDRAIITVVDDGGGFDPAAVKRTSLGLISMRERAEAVGALWSLRTGPTGTCVRLELPLDGSVIGAQ